MLLKCAHQHWQMLHVHYVTTYNVFLLYNSRPLLSPPAVSSTCQRALEQSIGMFVERKLTYEGINKVSHQRKVLIRLLALLLEKRWHTEEFEQRLRMDGIQASESMLGGFYKVQLKYCLCQRFDRASGAQCDSLAG